MSTHKYIVFRDDRGHLSFLIFPVTRQHKEFKRFNPLSAGFVRLEINDGNAYYECYGDSVSLDLKSSPILDSALLNALQ